MPLQQTSGNSSIDGYVGGAPTVVNYIEDFFQTWLRTGTNTSNTITTNIDSVANKSLVWIKSRSAATTNKLTDTVRGATKAFISSSTAAQTTDTQGLTAFSSSGYTIGTDSNYNNSGALYVDWQFAAKQKFFDIVTYTGTGANTTIPHNLGSVPGFIIVRPVSTTGSWICYHKNLTSAAYSITLNTTTAQANNPTAWNSTAPTNTVFSLGTNTSVNTSGAAYIAYLFADNAGGFGPTGNDNVISCGTFTTSSSNTATVNFGYEPQWVLIRRPGVIGNWILWDVMRGMTTTDGQSLNPNTATIETVDNGEIYPSATGFTVSATGGSIFVASSTYIYIAIRRGPMRIPTSGSQVFSPAIYTGTGAATTKSLPITIDLGIYTDRNFVEAGPTFIDRLRYNDAFITSPSNTGQSIQGGSTGTTGPVGLMNASNIGLGQNTSGALYSLLGFKRAPRFFDQVVYTGLGGVPSTFNHNLGVIPELMIVKNLTNNINWAVYFAPVGYTKYLILNSNAAPTTSSLWNAAPTATTFFANNDALVNSAGVLYTNYLFATLSGVSKVGSYTGTGASQTIDCGFSSGARFVLIKRIDVVSADWYFWDTARGMVSGTDPYLLMNSTAVEVNANYIFTTSTGFTIQSGAPANINASGVTFAYLAIA
jgi:hypothetical protein